MTESLLDSLSSFGTAEENAYLVFCLKLANFVANNVILHRLVGLVADQHYLHSFFPIFSDLFQPIVLYALKGLVVVKIERNNDSLGTFIICAGDGPEPFLSGSVPDLQFDQSFIDFESPTITGMVL